MAEESAAAAAPPVAQTTIGPDGAAGITTSIPLTLEAVRETTHLFAATLSEAEEDGASYPFITLSIGGELVFTLLPTPDHQRVNAITTRSSQARGPHGEITDNALFGQALASEVMFCRSYEAHEDFAFTCSDSEAGRFWRAYRMPEDYSGPTSPFVAIDPDAATRAVLVEMTWIAPR